MILSIDDNKSSSMAYSLIDICGKIIESKTIDNLLTMPNIKVPIRFDGKLPSGIYLLKVTHNNTFQNFKIIIQ